MAWFFVSLSHSLSVTHRHTQIQMLKQLMLTCIHTNLQLESGVQYSEHFRVVSGIFFFFFATKNGKTYIVEISLQVILLECGGVGLFVVVLFFTVTSCLWTAGQKQLKKNHISQ